MLHYESYNAFMTKKKPKFTKIGISSIVPALYDPAGLIQPYIMEEKIRVQKTWTYRDTKGNDLKWDDPLPSELKEIFINWTNRLEKISRAECPVARLVSLVIGYLVIIHHYFLLNHQIQLLQL